MIRVEIVAKTQRAADELAADLSLDDSMEVVRTSALGSGYRPDAAADVVIALGVTLQRLPASGPKVVLIGQELFSRVRQDPAVRAWLRGDASPAEITGAVAAAHGGLYALHGEQLPLTPAEDEIVGEHLTPRELAVLRMMADGSSNKEIAAELGISTNTAKFHVAQVMGKLQSGSRTEAVRVGIQQGLVLL